MNIAAVYGSWIGQLIDGQFPLLEQLGGSEHSTVYLTEFQGKQPQKVAIKLIPAETGDAETRLSCWKIAMGLSHPHLIRVLHIGRSDINGTPLIYVVMERAEENLAHVLASRPLTAVETEEMLCPLIDVLSFIHEKQLVHGRVSRLTSISFRPFSPRQQPFY